MMHVQVFYHVELFKKCLYFFINTIFSTRAMPIFETNQLWAINANVNKRVA